MCAQAQKQAAAEGGDGKQDGREVGVAGRLVRDWGVTIGYLLLIVAAVADTVFSEVHFGEPPHTHTHTRSAFGLDAALTALASLGGR